MSAAATDVAEAPKGGKKKLIMIIAIALVVVLAGGGAALMLTKKKHADEEGDEADGHAPAKVAKTSVKHDPKTPPTFVPLDMFTVNLADRDAERYAQIGITLEIGDPKLGDQLKTLMPAVRNNILMAIADKNAAQLMDRDGKRKLAREVQRETSKVLGFDVPDDEEDDEEAAADDHAPKPPAKGKKKKKKAAPVELPIRAVHFSNFIIQ